MKLLIISSDVQQGQRLQRILSCSHEVVELLFDTKSLTEKEVNATDFDGILALALSFRSSTIQDLIEYSVSIQVPIYIAAKGVSATEVLALRDLGADGVITDPILPDRIQDMLFKPQSKSRGAIGRMNLSKKSSLKVSDDSSQSAPITVPVKIDRRKKSFINEQYVIGAHPLNVKLQNDIHLVAATDLPIIIHGETGTGKEHTARQIHEESGRSGRFIPFDCGAINPELALSELYGHKRGSFTSAISDKDGAFYEAHLGTLFLDEVENLPYTIQMNLLRTLQEGRIRRIGDAHDLGVDVRVIVSTNQDLKILASQGKFRWDLYYRLNGYTIDVPSLKDIRSDIPELVRFFIKKYSVKFNKSLEPISEEVMDHLTSKEWAGNIRELSNYIKLMVLKSTTRLVIPTDEVDLNHIDDKFKYSRSIGKSLFDLV